MPFDFKLFRVDDSRSAMKVGTDGVLLGAWARIPAECRFIVDAGTGSGLIALMLAQRAPQARIEGVDIDSGAAADAEANFAASPFATCLRAVEMPIDSFTPAEQPDMVVCNPPFFSSAITPPSRQRHTARHQGALSPQSIISWAARHLSEHGTLAMVTPADGAADLTFHAELNRLRLWRQCRISTVEGKQPSRVLWQFSRMALEPEFTSMSVRTPSGNYTEAYRALMSDYYLKI